jgi:hypothetical protein
MGGTEMQDWDIIRGAIEEVLREPRYKNGQRCFLTAYQIAVLVDRGDSTLKGSLPLGGEGAGHHSSFAQQIAKNLSSDVNNGDTSIEMRYFSLDGLDSFTFGKDSSTANNEKPPKENGGYSPSENEFSMFRLVKSDNEVPFQPQQ